SPAVLAACRRNRRSPRPCRRIHPELRRHRGEVPAAAERVLGLLGAGTERALSLRHSEARAVRCRAPHCEPRRMDGPSAWRHWPAYRRTAFPPITTCAKRWAPSADRSSVTARAWSSPTTAPRGVSEIMLLLTSAV